MREPPRDPLARQALAAWSAGVDAVGGSRAVDLALTDWDGAAPTRIAAVGKAAAAMAQAALARFPGTPCLVVTKDGHGTGLPEGVRLIEAAHPVPDARSLEAGRALVAFVATAGPRERLLLLVSGGASSLAEDLAPGVSLQDLAALNRELLAAGLNITEMNTRRRALSRVKGGGLLAGFAGARVDVLAISDVPGDALAVIGSGLGEIPAGAGFAGRARIIASNGHARAAAARVLQAQGHRLLAEEEALHDDLAALAPRIGARLRAMAPGSALVLGGEPTVVLPDRPGRGGRNQALALALAREIAGIDGLVVVVGGTDGSDGPTADAGGVIDGQTWAEGGAQALAAADAGTFLAARRALLTTGPTGTNVMDLVVALRAPRA